MNPKPCAGLLVLVCKETGREVPTGVEYTQAELATTSSVTIHEQCPFCERAHVFSFADARVNPKPCEFVETENRPHEILPDAQRSGAGEPRIAGCFAVSRRSQAGKRRAPM